MMMRPNINPQQGQMPQQMMNGQPNMMMQGQQGHQGQPGMGGMQGGQMGPQGQMGPPAGGMVVCGIFSVEGSPSTDYFDFSLS
jgi:hypothetical protein